MSDRARYVFMVAGAIFLVSLRYKIYSMISVWIRFGSFSSRL